jgi:hypothetical protein
MYFDGLITTLKVSFFIGRGFLGVGLPLWKILI